MTSKTAESCHQAILSLLDAAERDARLVAELARAQRDFFGASGEPVGVPAERAAAATRFAEWFLLERESDVLGSTPLTVLARGRPDEAEVLELLRDSTVGVFRIEHARDREVLATDLQEGEAVDLREQTAGQLARGDLLIGRLYAVAEGGHVPSVATQVRREGAAVGDAIVRDLARLDLGRRLTQLELEHVLLRGVWSPGTADSEVPPLEHVEAEAEALLVRAGKSAEEASRIGALLREAPTPGIVLGPLLDEIAFESDADLDEVRRALLLLWTAQRRSLATRPESPPAPPKPRKDSRAAPGLGASIASRIEQGLASHEDLDAVFSDVENMFGERIDPDEPLDGQDGIDDGDLAGLVAEFLWETKSEHGPEAEALAALVRQQSGLPIPVLDAERLVGTDFLRLVVASYLAAAPEERVTRVRATADALRRFVGWLASTQEIALESGYAMVESVFLSHLPRVAAASARLRGPDAGKVPPQLWRVVATGERAVEVLELDGGATYLVATSEDAVRALRVGDLWIAALSPGELGSAALAGMVVVLPAGSEAVLG